MSAWMVNLAGLLLIGFVVWWFWLARPRASRRSTAAPIDIVVADGVYQPPVIEVPFGQPVQLRFVRRDPSPCAEQVRFDRLGVATDLPLHQPRDVTLSPPEPGEYEFTCQMGMYRGRLIVAPAAN